MNWWQIKKRDSDLERELRSDLELEEEEQREGGISEEEARYAALRTFGNPCSLAPDCCSRVMNGCALPTWVASPRT